MSVAQLTELAIASMLMASHAELADVDAMSRDAAAIFISSFFMIDLFFYGRYAPLFLRLPASHIPKQP